MTNAELIKRMRMCENRNCEGCTYEYEGLTNTEECKEDLLPDAAYALEVADKRIEQIEMDLLNGTISNIERFKVYDYTVKDLILFAEMCKRNDVREADLKQAAWNLELAVRAVMNERAEIVKNTPDFEKAFAEMRGEQE